MLDGAPDLAWGLATVVEAEMGRARRKAVVPDPVVEPALVVEAGRVGEPGMVAEPAQVAVLDLVVLVVGVQAAAEEASYASAVLS